MIGFWQQLINGVTVGSTYALIALGLAMVYGVLRILHIAHAGVFTLGAYVGLVLHARTASLPTAFLGAMLACGVAGVLIQRWLYRPLLNQPRIVPLIASIGLFIFMEDLFRLLAGPYVLAFRLDAEVRPLEIAGAAVTGVQVMTLIVTAVLLGAVWLLVGKTWLGLGWRAAAQDLGMAAAVGVNAHRVVALNFAFGSAVAGAAGVLIGALYNAVYPTMGSVPAYKALAVIVLGGLGNVWGTVVAGVLLGLVETFLVGIVGGLLPRDSIAFVALILMLLFRPTGLFGER
ncbi:MAG: branched-chain amino acid ABC transporter permease [Armatimonadota bacterium]|nr:branched-chain amino acid ABC transporter permease [Armatimonadota bacterium]